MAEGTDGGRLEAADAAERIAATTTTAATLLRTTALLDAIGKNSPDAIYAKDPVGRFLYANPAVLAIIGKSADVVLGHTDSDFHSDPEQAAAVMANDRRIMRGGTPEVIEETWTVANKGSRTYRSAKAPFYFDDGSLIGIVCVSSDITDLKAAEAKLRQASAEVAQGESQFRALANGIPQLCWIANADGWIFWYNDRWYQYTGTTPQQMEGWGWQSVHDPEALPKVLERWRASIATGQPFDMVFPLRGADGVFRPFLTRVMPVVDRDGNVSRWFGTNTDITEQRRAEDEIRAGKATLEAALASMTDAVFISDAKGNLIHVNAAFATYHRFANVADCSKNISECPNYLDVFLPNGQAAPVEQWALPRALRGEAVVGAEYRLHRKDTGESWVGNYCFAPIRDHEGNITGAVVTARDVTETKRAAEALKASEARLNLAIESAEMGTWERDVPARRTVWSPKMYDLVGLPPGAGIELSERFFQCVHPEDREALERSMVRAIEGLGRWRAEYRIIKPDGAVRWLASQGRLFRDTQGPPRVMFGVTYDITEQKQAEEEIRSSRARLEAALASMADGIFISDAQGNAIHLNEAFVKIYRFQSVAACLKTLKEYPEVFEVFTLDGKAVPFERLPIARALRGEIAAGIEHRIRRKDTGESWITALNFAPIRDADGNIAGVVFSMRDISENRAQEARIASLNEQLMHVTRAHELGQISAGIAHELNQPLAAIVNYASIARRLIANEDAASGDKAQEAIGKAGEQAKRASDIIRRMREFVERRQTHRVPEDVNDIVKDAVALALIGSKGDNIATILDLAPDLPAVEADRVQIEQVLVNLLRNAVQAMAASSKRELTISTHMNGGGAVEVTVTDTGPGISDEIADRLFQPFATTKADGMGVGLAISRSIIEAHGGQLGTMPNPAGGAVFRFTLPATATAPSIS